MPAGCMHARGRWAEAQLARTTVSRQAERLLFCVSHNSLLPSDLDGDICIVLPTQYHIRLSIFLWHVYFEYHLGHQSRPAKCRAWRGRGRPVARVPPLEGRSACWQPMAMGGGSGNGTHGVALLLTRPLAWACRQA